MTLAEAADRLGLSPSTLRNQVSNGALKAEKVGTLWMVTAANLELYKRNSHGQHKGGPRPKKGRKPR